MIVHTEAIVTYTLKYGEHDLIVKLFTQTSGMCTYLLRGILKSRKGKIRSSLFQPLSLLEIEASHKDKGTMETLKEAKILIPYQTLHTDIKKNAVVFFLAEILQSSIREQETNHELFQFLKNSFLWLDTHQNSSNFHISFLLKLTQYLGFSPDTSTIRLPYFNMEAGCFQSFSSGSHCREGVHIELIKEFLGIGFDASMDIKLSRMLRNEILHILVVYFELHLQGFKEPKSLIILNKIFK